MYIVTFTDGSTAIMTGPELAALLSTCNYVPYLCGILSYEKYVEPEPEPEPEPPPEPPVYYALTVNIDPPGAGSVQLSPMGDYVSPGKVSYPAGTQVRLEALPQIPGAYFLWWFGDYSGDDVDPVSLIIMDSDKEVTAVFSVPVPTFQLTTSVIGNGSIFPSEGVFNEGDQIILAASPGPDNVFVSWSGDIAGTTPVPGMPDQLVVTMDRDRHIVAEFELAPVPPEYTGSITRKELDYDAVRVPFPVQ